MGRRSVSGDPTYLRDVHLRVPTVSENQYLNCFGFSLGCIELSFRARLFSLSRRCCLTLSWCNLFSCLLCSQTLITQKIPASHSPPVREWLADEAQHVYAAALDPPRTWPWRLVIVDIYGRAGRWAEAAEAFDTYVGETTPLYTAASVEPWTSIHPSPLTHVVTAYLKTGRVEEAARALSFLRASLTAGSTDFFRDSGGRSENSDDVGEARDLPLGPPDPTWVDIAVRGFARVGRWDQAIAVLSTEICAWALAETGARGRRGDSGDGGRRGGLDRVLASLELFLGLKMKVKRPARGQVASLVACLEALESIRANYGGGAVAKDVSNPGPSVTPETREERQGGGFPRHRSPSSFVSDSQDCRREEGRDRFSGLNENKTNKSAGGVLEKQHEEVVYAEALYWLSLVEQELNNKESMAEHAAFSQSPERGSTDCHSSDAMSMARLLRSRSATLPQEAVLDAVRKAWVRESFEDSDPSSERRRSAAFALYEAGIESGSLAEGLHWASPTAGVVDLYCKDYGENRAVPLAALNLVLTDMMRRHAYGEEVGG